MADQIFDTMNKSDRLRDALRQNLHEGVWKADERLPSEAELAIQYQLSRSTIREAVSALVQEGLLTRVHGKGTFVTQTGPEAEAVEHRTFAVMLPFLFFSDPSVTQPFGAGADFLPRLIQAIEGEARLVEANVLLYLNNRIPALERENSENILRRRVDGVLMNYIGGEQSRIAVQRIQEAGIPVVLIDRYFEDLPADFVVTDNELGAYRATRLLIAQGFDRVVLVTSPGEHSSLRDRRRGYERAMEEKGYITQVLVVADLHLEKTGNDRVSEEERAYQLARTLLETTKPPFAIFATESPILGGIWRAFREYGLPHDEVAFACFDEPYVEFPKTVFSLKVIQSFRELGRRSIEALESRIAKTGPEETYRIFVEPEIITSKV